ncbi:MAG: zf-TFIIB domain-containing protein, partial [Verrucomicrobiota bacterium]
MISPIDSRSRLTSCQLEPDLTAWQCPASGGYWIPAKAYWRWKETHPPKETSEADNPATPSGETPRKILICPESGTLLTRYKVGHGLGFSIDRSSLTGGVWLDKGEWERLKEKDLHRQLHLIFTQSYQSRRVDDALEQSL